MEKGGQTNNDDEDCRQSYILYLFYILDITFCWCFTIFVSLCLVCILSIFSPKNLRMQIHQHIWLYFFVILFCCKTYIHTYSIQSFLNLVSLYRCMPERWNMMRFSFSNIEKYTIWLEWDDEMRIWFKTSKVITSRNIKLHCIQYELLMFRFFSMIIFGMHNTNKYKCFKRKKCRWLYHKMEKFLYKYFVCVCHIRNYASRYFDSARWKLMSYCI